MDKNYDLKILYSFNTFYFYTTFYLFLNLKTLPFIEKYSDLFDN